MGSTIDSFGKCKNGIFVYTLITNIPKFVFIKEGQGNYLEAVSTEDKPIAVITSGRGAQSRTSKVKIADFVEIMGWKAIGNKLTDFTKSTEIAWQEAEGDKKQAQLF